MEPLRTLKAFVLFEIVFVPALAAAAAYHLLHPLALLLLAIGVQAAALIYLFFGAVRPLGQFEAALKRALSSDERGGDKLSNLEEEPVYFREIRRISERSASQRIRESSAAMFDRQAELTALQSQINPHFLYNTLESIRGQALIDDNLEIAKMVEALAAFFRYSISRKGSLVTLRDELANIRNYMLIQRYRFNNRFALEIYVDEEDEGAYDHLIPKLTIQPVVENAIYHGLEDVLEGGKVTIDVVLTDQNLMLTVSDNGKGMDSTALRALNEKITQQDPYACDDGAPQQPTHTGIALPNIHKRIQLLFGEYYGLQVYSTPGRGTDVEITVPANIDGNQERNA